MKRMGYYLKIYAAALTAFLVIDAAWIAGVAGPMYQKNVGHLLAGSPNWGAAILFYLMFNAGLVYFAVCPGIREASSMVPGLLKCVMFGLMTYGTFGLTNLALIDTWPVSLTIVDMIWGMAVSVLVGSISIKAGKALQ